MTEAVNPLTRQLTQIRIPDNSGRQLIGQPLSLQPGQNFIGLPAPDRFPAGLYYLRVLVDGSAHLLKLRKE